MRERILNLIGISLLALCFIVSLTRIVWTHLRPAADGSQAITIRLAHWQLENGVREALDKIAGEYTKLHPGITVRQIPIPERIYTNWLITQLVGGTAPDIVQIGRATTEERLARFFTPLSELALAPNPYNRGTELEGMPFRETFFDGMQGGYNSVLLEYYGVPISGASIRMYYNLDLLRKITGGEDIPTTYEALVDLCRRVEAYAKSHRLALVPMAGSKYNSPILMNNLFLSQTQRLVESLNPVGILGGDALEESSRRAGDFLQSRWALDSEAVQSGFSLMHEVGQFMQPGFLQLQRDDATLLFVQARSLMICTGSFDATSIRRQAGFRVGVGPIPFPSRHHPVYGRFTLGNLSEAGMTAGLSLGLTRESKHAEAARDFLLFLAGKAMSQKWTDESGWIPSIVGVQPGPDVLPFMPIMEGYVGGFTPEISPDMADISRVVGTNLYRLVAPDGEARSFVQPLQQDYHDAVVSSMVRRVRSSRDTVRRTDTQLAAVAWLAGPQAASEAAGRRLDLNLQAASANDLTYFRQKLILEQAGKTSD